MSNGGARSQILLRMEQKEANRMVPRWGRMYERRRLKGPASLMVVPERGALRMLASIKQERNAYALHATTAD